MPRPFYDLEILLKAIQGIVNKVGWKFEWVSNTFKFISLVIHHLFKKSSEELIQGVLDDKQVYTALNATAVLQGMNLLFDEIQKKIPVLLEVDVVKENVANIKKVLIAKGATEGE